MQLLLSDVSITEGITCLSESSRVSEFSSLLSWLSLSLSIMMERLLLSLSSELHDPFEFAKHKY